MPKFLLLIGLFVYSLPYSCWAQRIETQVNKQELMDSEVLQLELKVFANRSPETPRFPEIAGFRKAGLKTPMLSRGARRLYRYIQSYFPLKSGSFEIPPFPVYVTGKKIFTDRIKGEVEAENGLDPNFTMEPISLDLLSRISKDQVKVGQAFRLDLCLDIPKNQAERIRLPELQSLQKNLLEQIDKVYFEVELSDYKAKQLRTESGDDFHIRYKLASLYLIPKKSGEFELGPFDQKIRTRWLHQNPSKKEKSLGLDIKYYESDFQSRKLRVKVDPLPKTQLPLARIVGNFNISDSLNKAHYFCGEPIELKVEIEGRGNLRAIPRLNIEAPKDFLLYDPSSRLEIFPDQVELSGKKTLVYQLISAKPGDFVLAPLKMYFFNPESQAFDSTQSDSIYLQIQGEPIPQLLQINVLDNFYRKAFSKSGQESLFILPYQELLIITAFSLSLLILLLTFFQPGFKIFGVPEKKKTLSPGLKKLIENKKS